MLPMEEWGNKTKSRCEWVDLRNEKFINYGLSHYTLSHYTL